ncbi:hypothetical protein JZK55_21350 [Dissulfurispira thermophila]|uniref:YkgJ family cysteine cluster protein n=1 Tax=Dissulfurispira thermophila TaxID=2715679 RepID=A0A7G1H4Y0_9BACT|nr:YkgJ family cysteine cluster protein [Dissulfurispira thermophila]BCB97213.1 hypothetical protein JZK55_21350 [Dissulfurispira thermophila]
MDKYLTRLTDIYKAIDNLYYAAIKHYNFSCEGCEDNCCATKFYHHTNIEELYLSDGLKRLDKDKKKEILVRAEEVVKIHNSFPEDVRVMCPLNENGLCIMYEHRPMICRIHGVPYQMLTKNMSIEFGTGCHRFINEKLNENIQYFMFNRTVFYVEMAKAEKELRDALNLAGDYKKTTAEMVVSILKPATNK